MISNQNEWTNINITLEWWNYINNYETFPLIWTIFGICFVIGLTSICHHKLSTIVVKMGEHGSKLKNVPIIWAL